MGSKLTRYIAELILRRLLAVKAEQARNVLLSGWYLARMVARRLVGKKDEPLADDIVREVRSSYPTAMDFDIKRLGINAGGLLIGAIETTRKQSRKSSSIC